MNTNLDAALNPREVRRKLGLNQQEFWSRIGVTQSGGSRYESGRRMPKPVRELLRLVHVERIDLARVNRADFELIEYIKTNAPDTYQGAREKIMAQQTVELSRQPMAIPAQPLPVAADDEDEFDGAYAFTASTSRSGDWSDERTAAHEELGVMEALRRR